MPTLVRVDPENYLGVFTLYSGTYLHYKYTLGDGVWNAERSGSGAFATRSVMLQGENPTLRDQVLSWSESTSEPIRFEVAIPEDTPPDDEVAIQFRAGNWRSPLPMWPQDTLWTFMLFGPESAQQELEYRFCRNMQCGAADEAGFVGQDAAGRPLSKNPSGPIQNVIEEWQWLDESALQQEINVDPLPLEYVTRGGVEFTDDFDPSWTRYVPTAFTALDQSHINEVTLSPAWTWKQNNPFPVLELDPTTTPLDQELRELVNLGRKQGMHISLRPSFHTNGLSLDSWWQQGTRNTLWWDLWFEEYRSFLLTYAKWSQQNGVEKLIIGGPEIIPALPFGSLPDGNPSGVPVDSEARWRDLMAEVRQRFAGQLAFELEYADELSLIPPFIELFDQVHVYWHSSIAVSDTDSADIQQATIKSQLDRVLDNPLLEGKPITISLAYLSLEKSAEACPPQPDGSCRALTDFSKGRIVDIDLERDLDAQALVYAAFLRAVSNEPGIEGISSRGFYPAVILHDKSLSVYGKPAQDVLAGWFRGLPE
jgi:hypothetical protein